jgi:hypothetical protein
MFDAMTDHEILSFVGYGIISNFIFSFIFGYYMSKNIGIETMLETANSHKQPIWMSMMLFIPFAKMAITLYRVVILQLFFLNQGKSHYDYWNYLTHSK